AYPNVANLGLFEPIFAVTNVDGRFELTGIGRGNLHVEVRHPAFTTASRKLAIGQAPTPINFELVPKSEVSGLLRVPSDVLAAIKTPPILLLRADAGDISSCTVAADGKFRFPAPFSAGLATLELLAGPLAFARSAAASIQVRIDEAPKTDLDLEAVAPASLQGRVVDATGRPLADVQVFLTQREQIVNTLREAGTALLEVDFGKLRDQVTRTSVAEPERLIAVSAADGSFRIAGLPAGAVTLHALRAGFAGRRFDADVPALGTAERMDDVVLRRGCRIDGQVVRADRPQTGAVVSAIGDAGNATAVVDADGRFVLEDLPAGDYRLRARFSTLPTVEQMVVASEQAAATVQLKFAPFGRQVSGKVVDPEGQPIANAYVVVGGRGVPELTDAAGQFTVEVPKGRVELRAFLGDRRAQSTVPVGEADKSVTITLDPPPTATLRAQVLALPARRRPASVVLKITPLDEGGATTQVRRIDLTDEGMRDPWFPAGRARVTIGGEGYAPWSGEVELQPGEVQSLGEVVLEPACTLLGRVVDDGGRPVAGCTVFLGEEGDEMLLRPQLRSAADGTFKLTGVCMAASNLVAKAPGFATRVLPLQLPRDVLRRDLLPVVLDRGSMIEVTVSGGLTGDEGFVLLFHNGRQVAATDLDAAGRATFANCAVGDYVVRPFGDDQVRREVHVLATGRSYPVTLP
ncbi:MAG TPA: carboxypeptidase regulatory-like domain-containing protein, partial [Planctomycetota bacterium]|nr:carboxypeptidase regulatory-like domain-containing protein [Planctomycetota bacterium]